MIRSVCRGVAVWHDAEATPDAACRTRVALATLDARVIELDLATGRPCEGFGEHGTVSLTTAPPPVYPGELVLDSPPAVLGDVLIVGSAIDDMTRPHARRRGARSRRTVRRAALAVRPLAGARGGTPEWRWECLGAHCGGRGERPGVPTHRRAERLLLLIRRSLVLEGMMSLLREKLLFVAATAVTVLAFIQSPSAQNSGTAGMGKDVSASAAAADKRAADAMLNQFDSAPTDADRKAAAAMQSKSAPTQ